jgi:ApbE superfamily uncharacterized protein (UPF0280 family)
MQAAPVVDSRTYRTLVNPRGLVSSRFLVKQTDMLVSAESDVSGLARALILRYRKDIEDYIRDHPEFLHALSPLPMDEDAPGIVRTMLRAGAGADVGPMAAVAGALADYVGRGLLASSREVVVENGGDIMLHVSRRREMFILAESSPFVGLKVAVGPTPEPLGICTSSGRLGPSLSFGLADAVTIFAATSAAADAAATAVANLVRTEHDIEAGIERARALGVAGVLILVADRIGVWGQVEIIA